MNRKLSDLFDLNIEVSLTDELCDFTVVLDKGSFIEVHGKMFNSNKTGSYFIYIENEMTYSQLLEEIAEIKLFEIENESGEPSYINLIPKYRKEYEHERKLSKPLSYFKLLKRA